LKINSETCDKCKGSGIDKNGDTCDYCGGNGTY